MKSPVSRGKVPLHSKLSPRLELHSERLERDVNPLGAGLIHSMLVDAEAANPRERRLGFLSLLGAVVREGTRNIAHSVA